MSVVRFTRRYIAPFFRVCRILRAPLFVSLLAFVVLSMLPPTREVYRVLADDYTKQRWQIAFAFLALILASGFVWHCARQVTLLRRRHALGESSVEGALLRWLPRLLAALIPLGAALGLYLAIGEADTTVQLVKSVGETRPWKEVQDIYDLVRGSPGRLWVGVGISLGLVAVLLVVTIARTRHKRWKYERPGKWLMGIGATVASLGIAAACVFAFTFAPPSFSQFLGAVTIFGLFLVCLVVILSSLTVLGDRIGVPLVLCVIAWAVVLAWTDRSENHDVELVTYDLTRNETGSYKPTGHLKDAFNNWYATRNDRGHYQKNGDPYPVFIVAAAGGGAYAAHYTATFLARLQDRCPNFAQHTFAISGVSGGSLGATVFAALAKQMAKNGDYAECDFSAALNAGPFESKVQEIFRADFLSPVVAGALFSDLVQRVLPWGLPGLDRSKALDATLEVAWRRAMEPDRASNEGSRARPLEAPFLDLWSPRRHDEAVPALVLNATEVANGYRTVISPLPLGGLPRRSWSKLQRLYERLPRTKSNKQLDIRLSTAAGISARFPFILPAASIDLRDKSKEDAPAERMRLVDGGYVESSAVETANEILQLLKGGYPIKGYDPLRETQDPDVEFKYYLIVLMGYEGVEDNEKGYGESAVPMRALISTWGSRADQTFMRAYAQNCTFFNRCHAFSPLPNMARGKAKDPCHVHTLLSPASAREMVEDSCHVHTPPPPRERDELETDVAAVFLNLRDFSLPLTWQLTEASRRIISLHAGVSPRCRPNVGTMLKWTVYPAEYRNQRIALALDENNCSTCLLQYKLADRSVVPNNYWQCIRRPAARGTAGDQ